MTFQTVSKGYHYLRYVDDVRILGPDKSRVQQGLILFDLELKRAGLVAQVTKTSVHEIVDIETEISRLHFFITDPTGGGYVTFVTIPFPPTTEQAGSFDEVVKNTSSDLVGEILNQELESTDDVDPENEDEANVSFDDGDSEAFQVQLRKKFLEAYGLLDDELKGKEAESAVTFCLFRLEPHHTVKAKILELLERLPWRSEAITQCLGRFKGDEEVAHKLRMLLDKHQVYSWHRANVLRALQDVIGAKKVADICRDWLSDNDLDWYAKSVAAEILADVPTQHAFFVERLRYEQNRTSEEDSEETAVLRNRLKSHSVA